MSNPTVPHIDNDDILKYAEKAYGINLRRTKITLNKHPEAYNSVATPMFDVIRKFSAVRTNTEFHLVTPDAFRVYVNGDFAGIYTYKFVGGKWVHVITSQKIHRQRSYNGIDHNQEFSSGVDQIVSKMNNYFMVFDCSKIMDRFHTALHYHFNTQHAPHYKDNTVHDRDYIKLIDKWVYDIHGKYILPNVSDDEALAFIAYHLLAEKDLIRSDDDWTDEEIYLPSSSEAMLSMFPDIQKFRQSFLKRNMNRQRHIQMQRMGVILRINRADRIQLVDNVQRTMTSTESYEALIARKDLRPDALNEVMHTLKVAGPGAYIPNMGMLMSQDDYDAGTMLWLHPERANKIFAPTA
jgi:hypothetical protein